ncbi:MAG: hypothetical protein Q4F85_15855 [Prevotella sp.]|nr:hypothetical protein [Prevotella sp.]
MVELYGSLIGLYDFYGSSNILGIAICMTEMVLGQLLLHKLYERVATIGIALLMMIFIYVTYVNLTNFYGGIESCGCFGEVIHLTASETFYKNILLMLLIGCLLAYHVYTWTEYKVNILAILRSRYLYVTISLSALLPVYSYTLMNRLEQTTYIVIYIMLSIVVLMVCGYEIMIIK